MAKRLIYTIKNSDKKGKKLMVIGPDGKKIHFGANGYGDFIQYSKEDKMKAIQKKNAYIKRHQVNEDWTDLTKSGTWSRYILWGEPSLEESIKQMEKLFKIQIN